MCRMPKNKAVERRPMGAHAATHSEIPRSLHCIFYADIVDIEADQDAPLLDKSQTAARHRLRQAIHAVEMCSKDVWEISITSPTPMMSNYYHLRNDTQHNDGQYIMYTRSSLRKYIARCIGEILRLNLIQFSGPDSLSLLNESARLNFEGNKQSNSPPPNWLKANSHEI